MILLNTRFGELEYNEDEVIYFNEGLLGFSQCQHFLLIPHNKTNVFKWLQSIEEPLFAWPIVDPCIYVPDYKLENHIDQDQQVSIYSIVNIPAGKPLEGTMNLLAPVIIDFKKSTGRQIVVDKLNYPLKYPLFEKMDHQDAA